MLLNFNFRLTMMLPYATLYNMYGDRWDISIGGLIIRGSSAQSIFTQS
jgi:hypothetical protein